jgi:hypothetical protein
MNLVMVKKPAVFLPVPAIYFALLLLEAPKQPGRILALLISNQYLQMYTELQQDCIFVEAFTTCFRPS